MRSSIVRVLGFRPVQKAQGVHWYAYWLAAWVCRLTQGHQERHGCEQQHAMQGLLVASRSCKNLSAWQAIAA